MSGDGQTMPLQAMLPPLCTQQAPFMQRFDPGGQTTPQPPQLLRSPPVSTQVVPAAQQVSDPGQPLVLHGPAWQKPPTQLPPAGQTLPQKPQLLGSVPVLVSQPSPISPSQSAKPALHAVIWQEEATHEELPLTTAPQAMPQPPQLLLSDWVLAHRAPQQTCPPGHPAGPHAPTQTPPEHASPAGHFLPQPPQLLGSEVVLVSQPLATTPSQLPKPERQPAMPQLPALQSGTALGKGPQTLPHEPQSVVLVAVFTQRGEQQVRPLVHA